MPEPVLLISCEHAVNHVPSRFAGLFASAADVLASHRGYDAGALDLADTLAGTFRAPCFAAEITRLLVDHNRSPHNRALWSEYSRPCAAADKTWLLETFYRPFRARVGAWIEERVDAGQPVLHLSIHSFTPVLDGKPRTTDIGILYDPHRGTERAFGRRWQGALQASAPALRTRLNSPYRGVSDGHQRHYRQRYPSHDYLAVELEVNQRLVTSSPGPWLAVKEALCSTLQAVLADGQKTC